MGENGTLMARIGFKDSTDVELPNGSVTNNSGLCPTNQNFN